MREYCARRIGAVQRIGPYTKPEKGVSTTTERVIIRAQRSKEALPNMEHGYQSSVCNSREQATM